MAKYTKRPRDVNQLAKLIIDTAVGEVPDQAACITVSPVDRLGDVKGDAGVQKISHP